MKIRTSILFIVAALGALLFTVASGVSESASLSWPYVDARVTRVEWKTVSKHDSPPVCCVPLIYLDVNGRQVLVSPFRRYIKETDRVTFSQNTEGKIIQVQANPDDADELIMEPGFSVANFSHTFAGGAVFLVLAALSIMYLALERRKLT